MKNYISKIKEFLSTHTYWQAGSRQVFLFLIFLLLLDLVIAMIFFFKYGFQKERIETYSTIKINQDLINKFSIENQKKEALFQKAKDKIYLDFFGKN